MSAGLALLNAEARSRKPVQALLEERMGGAQAFAAGCAVFTRRGVRLVCKDGPRFELRTRLRLEHVDSGGTNPYYLSQTCAHPKRAPEVGFNA
jgi:hypothetical protein